MRAIGRGVAAAVIAGCVALAATSRGAAETLDEQPIAVPEPPSHGAVPPGRGPIHFWRHAVVRRRPAAARQAGG